MPIKLEHIFSAPFLRSVLLRKNLLKKYAPKIRSAAVNICCKFLFGNTCVLYGNAYKLRARLSQPLAQRADLAASHPPPLISVLSLWGLCCPLYPRLIGEIPQAPFFLVSMGKSSLWAVFLVLVLVTMGALSPLYPLLLGLSPKPQKLV